MIRLELYDADRPTIIIERDEDHIGAWSRLQEAFVRGVIGGTETRLDVRADVVFSELEVLRDNNEAVRAFSFQCATNDTFKDAPRSHSAFTVRGHWATAIFAGE